MATSTTSPNMSLVIPTVGSDPGPQWAFDINASLNILDSHNHASGSGVPIPSAGLSINADLPFGNNNATTLRSIRFTTQASPLATASDVGCLYESGVDLYYNDGNGNQVRMTQSGGVAGTPGSIGGLTSPASATYVAGSQTFIWQSDAVTPANMDCASIILRNLVANSKGLTLSPPNAMGANYALTLPSLPASQKFMTLDSSGTMSAPWSTDNTTVQISSNQLSAIMDGVTMNSTGPIAARNVMFEHEFKLNGDYSGLSGSSLLQLDGLCFFNFNATIVNCWAWIRSAGGAGTTTIDLKVATAPGGSFATIFSTKPAFASTAGASAYVDCQGVVTPGTGVTAGVLSTTSIAAGSAIKMDLTGVMTSAPDSVGITIVFKQR